MNVWGAHALRVLAITPLAIADFPFLPELRSPAGFGEGAEMYMRLLKTKMTTPLRLRHHCAAANP
jgi:hypothetical protein